MSLISGERTFTWRNLSRLSIRHVGLAAFFLLLTVPFCIFWRGWPSLDFYPEVVSLSLGVVLALAAMLGAGMRVAVPKTAVFFALFGLFLIVQARLMPVVYRGNSDLAAGAFFMLALFALGLASLVQFYGRERIMKWLVAGVLFTVAFQDVVCFVQFLDIPHMGMFAMYVGSKVVVGNIAQRNMLAHFLMWGMLIGAYAFYFKIGSRYVVGAVLAVTGVVLGMVPSRAILLYLIVLFPVLILAYWRGSSTTRGLVLTAAVALAWVLLWQLVAAPVFEFFTGATQDSAVERLSTAKDSSTMRWDEWIKCWVLIKERPWFGYGWGGYVYHAYAVDMIPQMDSRPQRGMLFLNPHNSFLHLAVDMGLVGLGLVLAGLVWCLWGALRAFRQPEQLILLLAMAVTLVHCVVEFPLWWLFFTTVFVAFMVLSEPKPLALPKPVVLSRVIVTAVAVVVLGKAVLVWGDYNDLVTAMENEVYDMPSDTLKKMDAMIALGQKNYLIQPFAEFAAIRPLKIDEDTLPAWAMPVTQRYAAFRPYASHAYRAAYLQYRFGDKQKALHDLHLMMRNYRIFLPIFTRSVQDSKHYQELFTPLYVQCEQYRVQYKLDTCLKLPEDKNKAKVKNLKAAASQPRAEASLEPSIE